MSKRRLQDTSTSTRTRHSTPLPHGANPPTGSRSSRRSLSLGLSRTRSPSPSPSSNSSPRAKAMATANANADASSHAAIGSTGSMSSYLDRANHCRNPFCGALLTNKRLKYCVSKRFCQLRRGLLLSCAWPRATADSDEETARDYDAYKKSGTTRRRLRATAGVEGEAKAKEKTGERERGRERTGKRAADSTSADAIDEEASRTRGGKKARVLKRHASADSVFTASATAQSQTLASAEARGQAHAEAQAAAAPLPPPLASTTTQQVKKANIDVVPLGIGNREGGGGRYVRSGNRSTLASTATSKVARPPTFTRFTVSSSPSTPSSTSASSMQPWAMATPARGSESEATESPSRALFLASSDGINGSDSYHAPPPTVGIPIMTTNRERDPRTRSLPSPAASSAASGTATLASKPSMKRISAADYLNNRKTGASEPRGAPSSTSGLAPASASASVSAPAPASAAAVSTTPTPAEPSISSAARGDRDRPPLFRRSVSDASNARSTGYDQHGISSSTSTSASTTPRGSSRESMQYDPQHSHPADDRKPPPHPTLSRRDSYPQPSRSPSGYGNSSPSSSGRDERDRHRDRDRGDYNYRYDSRSSSNSGGISSIVSMHPVPRAPNFSRQDSFLKLVLSRMVSFLPKSLEAVLNDNKKPRKLRFYLDYAQRVHDYCGDLVKISVSDSVARVTIADRDWLVIHGGGSGGTTRDLSTPELYQLLLEQVHARSKMWLQLTEEVKGHYAYSLRRLGAKAITGYSFLKVWQAMKRGQHPQASRLDRHSTYFRGYKRHHWSFCIGNVVVGSGSDLDKMTAFHNAANSAYEFVSSLQIYDGRERYNVAKQDAARRASQSNTRSTSSNASTASSNGSGAGNDDGATIGAEEGSVSRRYSGRSRLQQDATDRSPGPDSSATPVAPPTTANELIDEPQAEEGGGEEPGPSTPPQEVEVRFSPISESEKSDEKEDSDDAMSISDGASDAAKNDHPPHTTKEPQMQASLCHFCQDLQAHKPGDKCLRCRRSSRASLADNSGHSVDALHAFLRRPPDSMRLEEETEAEAPLNMTTTLKRLQSRLQSHR